MIRKMEVSPTRDNIDISARDQWLDKLWSYLFDGNSGGLMSPGQIRREHRDRERVRQIEMATILEAEKEINGIHSGRKTIDASGNLIDTPPIDTVATHQIIENTSIDQDLDLGLDTPAAMIRSVVKELSVRDLERSLNVRKIAILAESEILDCEIQPVSSLPVNAEWMVRWRESAENVFNPELQLLWARTLAQEVATPGSYSLGLMATLKQLNLNDLEMVRIISMYAFPDFIYTADSYFNTDYHRSLFEVMEDLGLVMGHSSNKCLSSESDTDFNLILFCNNKALQISANQPTKELILPVLKLSRIGRQLFPLCGNNADLAYLFDLAGYVKKQGFQVALGDWEIIGRRGYFVERMNY